MFDFFKVQKVTTSTRGVKSADDFEYIPQISKYIKEYTGIDFNDQEIIFTSKIKSFCRTHKIESFNECLKQIQNDITIKQELVNYVTTNESFFYREFHQIASLVSDIQKSSLSHVKILCAPSANGEEPYSIAIALLEANISINSFEIVGIDISSEAITKAKSALYNEKAIRNLSSSIREKYFTKEENEHRVNSNIRNRVSFICVNIFDDAFKNLGKFDYIFSRNMLIYFDTHTRLKAQKLFNETLKDPNNSVYFGHADLTHEHKH